MKLSDEPVQLKASANANMQLNKLIEKSADEILLLSQAESKVTGQYLTCSSPRVTETGL